MCVSVYKTTADYIPVDLSKESNIEAYIRELRKLYPHGVDILVNNAGNPMIRTALTFCVLCFVVASNQFRVRTCT